MKREEGSACCSACKEAITDKYLLQVSGRAWHASCLRCCVCRLALDRQPSCFIREDSVYCKLDYAKSFGAKCSKCCRSISATDWVRKARERVYHLACFACDACKRQLSTGEEFALHDGRLLCKAHYLETLDGGSTSSDEGGESESYQKNKAKRVRTTFTEEQLQVLQANFQLDSNPDGQDLERIAQITGLSKRVTQVWFQNSRARQKKHLHTGKLKGQIHHASAPIPRGDTDSSPFGRHINLHLTYSFQSPPSLSQQPNVVSAIPLGGATNNNNSKVTVVSASAPSPVPPTTNTLFPSHAHVSMDSSLDQTPQDSLLSCMQGEV
ncbi:LIM/homeobox protein Awh isoform X1 [Ischnura elegans]|uniref:LIM/homeobox protein Awh isoform X1 n=1 Tax=Ischnura elegans TaxID=197161 RepID=UPI001ED8B28C|nr:LIM/homeobox protein Awh isoform X1 [Ischnura elegans]